MPITPFASLYVTINGMVTLPVMFAKLGLSARRVMTKSEIVAGLAGLASAEINVSGRVGFAGWKLLTVNTTPVSVDCLEAVKNAIATHGSFEEMVEGNAGCTVSCHCGPGTLGVLFVRK